MQLIPAVSDADGPDPRSYTYQMTADEQQAFEKKIRALASEELVKAAKQIEPDLVRPARISSARGRSSAEAKSKPPQPVFHDMNLRGFDVATSNEPILIFTAKAQLPTPVRPSAQEATSPPEFYVALVAHSDLYGTLRPLFSAITNREHLDVTPRFDLIDVIDADGDGRGELLFRKTSDQGSAYAVYRVGADKLWPLYDGTPPAH